MNKIKLNEHLHNQDCQGLTEGTGRQNRRATLCVPWTSVGLDKV